MDLQQKETKGREACLRIVQDMLHFMKDFKPQPEEKQKVAIIVVPIPKIEVKFVESHYEGTLRERCKKRKNTSRRRREFEAAKARQQSS